MASFLEIMTGSKQQPFVKPYTGHLEQVPLGFIEQTDISQLKTDKLQSLRGEEHMPDGRTLMDIMVRPPTDGPIVLDITQGRPYTILNGRHRVHVAREKRCGFVMACLQGK